jgi:hypothetical protein
LSHINPSQEKAKTTIIKLSRNEDGVKKEREKTKDKEKEKYKDKTKVSETFCDSKKVEHCMLS